MTEKPPLPLTASHEEILPVFDKISLFGGLDKVQTSGLLSLMGQVSYSEDEEIFLRGAQPSHIYIVVSGRVRLDFGVPDHPLAELHFDAGDCFGETSVIGIQPHVASAIADQATQLLVLSREALMSLYATDTNLFALLVLNIAREAARRLHEADKRLSEFPAKLASETS
jgi:CRP/FNR family cyclic AMP-dependent transcriptional regulator